jgi:uncharacterized membrane protein YdjX (TVP38/TMEM64 family)
MIPQNRFKARPWLLGAFLAFVCAGGALAIIYRDALTLDAVEAFVRRLGVWAPVGFVAIYALATVAMIPGGFFDALGGAIFGPVLGTIVNLLGASVGAMLAFFIARHLAGGWVEARGGARVREIQESVEAEGWRFVAMVRLIPIFPYTIFNYVLGLTRIPFWQYALATCVCMAPSTVGYTWLGHAGRNLAAGGDDEVAYGIAFFGILASVLFLPRMIKTLRTRRVPVPSQPPRTHR